METVPRFKKSTVSSSRMYEAVQVVYIVCCVCIRTCVQLVYLLYYL